MVAWFGPLARTAGERRATIVSSSADGAATSAASITGRAGVAIVSADEPRSFVFDPDASVLAAGLLGALAGATGLASLGANSAYLTGDAAVDVPHLERFAVKDVLPLRARTVADFLAARGVGMVEIKKRGVPIEPDRFRRELKLRGDASATVILTRIGKRQVAIVAQRPAVRQD
jgi:hypothetical protein